MHNRMLEECGVHSMGFSSAESALARIPLLPALPDAIFHDFEMGSHNLDGMQFRVKLENAYGKQYVDEHVVMVTGISKFDLEQDFSCTIGLHIQKDRKLRFVAEGRYFREMLARMFPGEF